MKTKTKILIAIGVAVCAAALIGFGVYNSMRAADTGIPKNAIPVQLETSFTETITQRVTAKGEVRLKDEHMVYPKGQGRFSEVLVKKGDEVRAGQVIARYDAESLTELNDRLTEAKLAVKAAELALRSAGLPVVSALELAQAEAGVVQAQDGIAGVETQIAQYELTLQQIDGSISQAQKKYDNTRLLYDRGAVSGQELDLAYDGLKQLLDQRATVEAQRAAALADKRRAEEAAARAAEQYELTLARQDEPQVANMIEQQQLAVEQARLRVSQIEHELSTYVSEEVCPYNGVVLELGYAAGETATAAKPVVRVADVTMGNLTITVNVPEADAVDVRTGQAAEIRGGALGTGVLRGEVGKIAAVAEEQVDANALVRVLAVEIIPLEDAGLKAGYTVEADIVTRVSEDAVVVPLMATMSTEEAEDYVFVMREDFSVERRVVELGGYSGMNIEVLAGVGVGEKVVVNPPAELADGVYVKPVGMVDNDN